MLPGQKQKSNICVYKFTMDFREWYDLNEGFYFPGLKFFRQWLLPNTTMTKNPLYKWLELPQMTKDAGNYNALSQEGSSLLNSLKERLKWAYAQGGVHAALLPFNIMELLGSLDSKTGMTIATIGILVNLYAAINQLDLSLRLKKAINYRAAKQHLQDVGRELAKQSHAP